MKWVIGFMAVYGLLALVFGPILRRRAFTSTLKSHAEWRKEMEAKYPEMIGKWGKP